VTNQELLADKIFDEFDRLGVSTHQDAYSGLMAEHQNLLVEGQPDVVVVKVYDDYADGLYNAELVLAHLATLAPGDVDLESDSSINIWQSLKEFEL
jgi:hypothetical protein